MRLIKLYGKEDIEKIVRQESDKIFRKLDKYSRDELRKIVNETKKVFYETNKEIKNLKIKLNDIEKIMERYENKY
jgi:BMFP domain-containing protein YqiC